MRVVTLIPALLLAACDCPVERVSPVRGVAEHEGTGFARMDTTVGEAMGASCSRAAGICWFPAQGCRVRGLPALLPASAPELPTWLAVDCLGGGAFAIPLPDLRTADGTFPVDVPLARGGLPGFRPEPFAPTGRGLAGDLTDACPADAWPEDVRFVGELRILERAGGPGGEDTLVTDDFGVRAELDGRVVAGAGDDCAVPYLDLTFRFVQTPYEYGTVGDRCE